MAYAQLKSETVFDKRGDCYMKTALIDDTGKEITKTLSLDTYLNFLKRGMVDTTELPFSHLGKMPYGYYDASFTKNDTFTCAVVYEAKRRGVKYHKKEYLVPHPSLVFIFSVNDGILRNKQCFAIQGPLTGKSKLYRYPFGNVSKKGWMCFGSIELPKIESLADVDKLVTLFLCGDVNDDYYDTTKGMKQYQLLEKLENEEVFPKSYYTPASDVSTFADVFKI